jgi:hypothetical protein
MLEDNPLLSPQDRERLRIQKDAMLTPSVLLAFKRIAEGPDWPLVWKFLNANFPLHDPVFVRQGNGRFDYLDACKRDGQRDVMLLVDAMMQMPTPQTTETAEALLEQ